MQSEEKHGAQSTGRYDKGRRPLNHTMKNKHLQNRLDGATRQYGEGEIPPLNHPVMSDLVIVAQEPTVSHG